jgi:uncharacterized peroxidase-related enzyme
MAWSGGHHPSGQQCAMFVRPEMPCRFGVTVTTDEIAALLKTASNSGKDQLMSRIQTPPLDAVSAATAEVYAQIKKAAGSIPNTFAAIGAYGPAALKSVLQADATLASGSLSKQDQETVKLIVSSVAGCDYCVAAHSLLGKLTGIKDDMLEHIRAGQSTGDIKRDALSRFVRNLMQTSGTISDQSFNQIKAAGYTDNQLVDICLAIAVTVFTNAFNRINDTEIDFPAVS